jgi:WD40 repeat protein
MPLDARSGHDLEAEASGRWRDVEIGSAAFSPDGRYLATGGLESGGVQMRHLPEAIARPVRGSDSDILANSGADGTVELWDVGYADLIRRLCNNAGTPITVAQWRTYLGSSHYAPPSQRSR